MNTPQEAGRLLFDRRQRLGTSVAKVSETLHIPVAHLQALEAGDFSVFSAVVYARGAYTRYAQWLGIDGKYAQRVVLRALSEENKAVSLRVHTPETWLERLMTPRLVLAAAGMLLVLLVGGYITWQLRSFWQLPALALVDPKLPVIYGDSVMVRGISEQGAQITVNGEKILLNEHQSFEVDLRLRPGINVVRAEAENAAGRVRVVEQHLLHPRDGGTLE